MNLHLSMPMLRRILYTALIGISSAGLGVELWDESRSWPVPRDTLAFFSLSYESNLPTWYSSCLLWTCAVLLALIASHTCRQRAPYRYHWWVLAAAFFYISLDEFVEIHEDMSKWMDLDGVLYFSWVVPAGIAVTAFGLAFIGFLAHLPWDARKRFILAGSLYVGGALVMELPLGYWTDIAGSHNLTYGVLDWIEESLEITGLSVFVYSLTRYSGFGIRDQMATDMTQTDAIPHAPESGVQHVVE